MKIVSGIDLVYIPRFKKTLKSGGENFLRRVFHETELVHPGGVIQHLAGIFAAKESIIKALGLPTDSWHEIRITHHKNGAPRVQIENCPLRRIEASKLKIENCSLSISHDGNYVIAQFLGILEDDATS